MRQPTVLHCARDWLRPSEGFVASLVAGCSDTRSAVVTERAWPGTPAIGVDVHVLDRRAARAPARLRRAALSSLVAGFAVRERARLLHQHFGYWTPVVAPAAAALRVPWVVSLHGHDLLVEAANDARLMTRLGGASIVIVPSTFLADRASRLGLEDERLRVVPSGVDLGHLPFRERQPPSNRPPLVVFAGRFVAKKGVLDAVEALDLVPTALRAVFVGSGPLELDLRRRLESARFPAEVRDGSVPGAVVAALAEADVVLTASRPAADGDDETLGLINLEALALGAPLVTTRSGGIPETLGAAADLVPPGDVQALAGALQALLAAPETWSERGHRGRAHVAGSFERGSRIADVEEIYGALLSRRPVPRARPPGRGRPRVSVVIATRDRRELLDRALDAVLHQTYPSHLIDVAVIDNGSSDGTAHHLQRLAAADARLQLVQPAADHGVAAGRNRAVAATHGDIVVFTDDDCCPTHAWLECLVAGFRDGVDIVQGRTSPDPQVQMQPLSRSQHTLSEYGLYETCNIAYRRSAFDGAGGFDEGFASDIARHLGRRFARYPFGEDTDLAWRAKRAGSESRFSVTAEVHHHVFPPSTRLLIRRTWVGAAWPLLVDRTPELRARFLTYGVFLSRRRALVALAGAGATLSLMAPKGTRAAVAAASGGPYLLHVIRPAAANRGERIRAFPVLVLVDAVQTLALLYGSFQSRSLVL